MYIKRRKSAADGKYRRLYSAGAIDTWNKHAARSRLFLVKDKDDRTAVKHRDVAAHGKATQFRYARGNLKPQQERHAIVRVSTRHANGTESEKRDMYSR
jgi:hypothetical protein